MVANAQSFKTQLDDYFQKAEASGKIMLSASIVKNGKAVYEKSIGFKSLDSLQKPNSETQYRIGSITKVFTAVMIFQLIEEGKLSLSSKLSGFFPSVSNAEKITIAQLLSHRSGIHEMLDDMDYRHYMEQPQTKDQMVKRINNLGSDFEPDSQTQYSNSGYVLLGYIIEEVSGKSYNLQLQERVCKELGLTRTKYGGMIDSEVNHARSYEYIQGWQPFFETHMSVPHGAGAVISTPTEIGKFIHAIFHGKLINQSSLDKMTHIINGHGHGILPVSVKGFTAYGHDGSIDAFISDLVYVPEKNLAIAVCSNGLSYDIRKIMSALMRGFENKEIKAEF